MCRVLVGLLSLALTLIPGHALGSGSYTGRAPRQATGRSNLGSIDRAKYYMGQHIFNGSAKLTAKNNSAKQLPTLQALQEALPAGVAKEKSLLNLAGRLSDEQLAALQYFVNRRFPARPSP